MNFRPLFIIPLCLPFSVATVLAEDSLAQSGAPRLEELWATAPGMLTPESVLYDSASERIYVSNMAGKESGDGFISILAKDGSIKSLHFIAGLRDPKGMGLHGKQLYIADVTEIVVASTETGEVLNRYKVPEAEFLNDIAIDEFGVVYATDSATKKIHKIENGYLRTLGHHEEYARPNGLYVVNPVTLLLASSHGNAFGQVDLESGAFEVWVEGIPHADGIARDRFGNYFVSSWRGHVFYVYADRRKVELLDTEKQGINSADIDLMVEEDILLVPTFNDNRVVAYKVRYAD